MTPQLYIKLTSQIARQTAEAEALESQAVDLQPSIDSAKAWVDSCQASHDSAQAALTDAQAIKGADLSAQQEAVKAASDVLDAAKSDLATAKAPLDAATAHARQIRAAIAQCQETLDAGGLTMSDAEIAQYAAQQESARLIASFTAALEAHYDATAQQRRYDSRYTCSLRAGYPGPFQAEGLAFATWMDDCNAQAYTTLAAVQAGQRAMPGSPAALIAELPAMAWPGA